MKKRLSIFDLQEGKVYQAFDGNRQLGKMYRVQGGKLQNANRDEDPNDLTVYDACAWVPLKADVHFKEIKGASTGPVSILAMKEGTIYEASAQIKGYVARKGTNLVLVDSKGKGLKNVELATVSLSTMFNPIGKISAHTKAWETRRKAELSR